MTRTSAVSSVGTGLTPTDRSGEEQRAAASTAPTKWVRPAIMSTMRDGLRIHIIGHLEVEGIAEHDLGSRKGRQVLKALAVAECAPVRVDALVEVLWPDRPPARPHDQVGVLVSRLRAVVGNERIERTDAGYRLLADWLDVTELRERSAEATAALTDGRVATARAAAAAAISIVRGELLADEDGDWVEGVRAEVLALVANARRVAVEAAAAAGDLATAVRDAEAALARDPYDERLVGLLMQAHAASGRTGSALAAYAALRERLVEDLGVAPGPEIEALHTGLLTEEPVEPDPPAPPGRRGELVGRDRQRALLDRSLQAVRESGSQLVVLEGEPGIGKTALARDWLADTEPTATVMYCRCDPLGCDLPLQPLADALATALALARDEELDIPDGDRILLHDALGIGTDVPVGPADHEPGEPDVRLYAAMLRTMERLAGDDVLVVFVDDLHAAGRSTLEWLAFARRRSARTLVVATRRPGSTTLPDETVIRLPFLERDDVVALAGDARADDLLRRSGGNPLLLSALIDATGDGVPESVRGLAEHQLASLHGADTVRAAAVVGRTVDVDLVAAMTMTSAIDVLGHLEEATHAGLLVEEGAGFAFRHGVVREALEAGMTSARRALVHRDAARALARRPEPDIAAVAHHARLGGDVELAAEALVGAAAAAERRYDLGAAEEYLDRAVELADGPGVRVARARVRMARARLDEADGDAGVALRSGGGVEALAISSWIAYYQRRYDAAEGYAEQAAAASVDDPEHRTSAAAVLGRIRHGRGELADALTILAAVEEGPPHIRAVADVWHALALTHAGRPEDALRLADRALTVGERMAQPFAPFHGRFARIMALGHLGRLGEATAAAEQMLAMTAHAGAVGERFVGPAWNTVAWTRRAVGRHDEADEANQRAYEATGGDAGPAAIGVAEAHWVSLLDLVEGALVRGTVDEAEGRLARLEGLTRWNGTMAWHQRHRLELQRARLALMTGRGDEAAERAVEVARDASVRGAGRYAAIASTVAVAAGVAPESSLGDVLERLDRVAGAESWWLTALVAASTSSDEIRAHATRRASASVAAAGVDADSLAAWVARVLG